MKVEGDPEGVFREGARRRRARPRAAFPAPLEIVACVEAAVTRPFDEGRKFERERFAVLVEGNESKALRHMFFAERQTSKIPDVPDDTPMRPIKSAAVIGAGTMGGGIAMNFANAGIPVSIMDMTQDAVDKGVAKIKANYASTVSKGRLKQEEMDKRMALIKPTTKLEDGKDADIVIEAVFERMDVKQDMFRKLDAIMKPGAILATNTSTLDVNAIADVTKRPQDVIGTHFFSPANVMRLLEVVRGAKTGQGRARHDHEARQDRSRRCRWSRASATASSATAWSRSTASSRCSCSTRAAARSRWTPRAYKWGMAMGPLAMGDMAGLDIGWEIRKRRYVERPNFVYSKVGDKVAELGPLRPEDRQGLVQVQPARPQADSRSGSRRRSSQNYRKDNNIKTRQISDEEIVERLIYALVNEARLHPRGRHRAASVGHRHGLPHRLRLPGLPRRADVLRRHGRACRRCWLRFEKFTGATGRRVEAGPATRETRKRRENIQWLTLSSFPPHARRCARAGAAPST